ncbi:MAG: FG-GAP-like repeat-containing protein, partial [Phycisphaerae bacterium]
MCWAILTIACSGVEADRRCAAQEAEPVPGTGRTAPVESGVPDRVLTPGHRRMLTALSNVAKRLPQDMPALDPERPRQLRERLARLGIDAGNKRRRDLHSEAAEAEFRLGNFQAAIDEYTKAYKLLPPTSLTTREANQIMFRLGVAYLRLGEAQNCWVHKNAQNCLLPVEGQGVHTRPESSRLAIRWFLRVLENPCDDGSLLATVKWLLNIAHMTVGGYPAEVPTEYLVPPSRFAAELEIPRFTNVAPKLGIDTFSWCGGAIVDDFDNDNFLDIVTSTADTDGQMRFYRNNGDGTFQERTEQAGLLGLLGGLNMVQADYNNDGFTDILVLRGAWHLAAGRHPNSLLRNNGDGTFTDVTFDAGLGEVHYPTQTGTWGDYDLDGDLDLYIGNETSPELSAPCQLFRNNGDGTFTDVASQAGVRNYRYTKGVVWGDFNGDRRPDLYVSNGGSANRLYHNNGDGTFTDVAPRLGMTLPERSFACWFWDFDNDGILDLFVGSYTARIGVLASYYLGEPAEFEMPRLYRGDGRTGFT